MNEWGVFVVILLLVNGLVSIREKIGFLKLRSVVIGVSYNWFWKLKYDFLIYFKYLG